MSIDWKTCTGEQLLDNLQSYCIEQGISDVHCSPEKNHVRIEVRQDGLLQSLADVTHAVYIDYLRRLKFVSKLKLNLSNTPQDGQYTFAANDRQINVRIATIPSRFGEAATMRFLDPKRGIVPLEQLGFPDAIREELQRIAFLPHGLFLICGPTGSGKTTTLYALLQTIVGTHRNIITLEDPVEYELDGVVQSQIDPDHDYTFSRGLRSVLRHDPDVILVGEIRDYETAQTAVDAALTGHLVLSTIHTNSALEAIPRFLSMGVSPYTFAPALRAVLAQRLVRTLRSDLRGQPVSNPSDSTVYQGRIVLPELLVISPLVEEQILLGANGTDLLKTAKQSGFREMQEWGTTLVSNGVTTQMEVERVAKA